MTIRKISSPDTEMEYFLLYKAWKRTYPNEQAGVTEEDIDEMFSHGILEGEELDKRQKSNDKESRDGRSYVGAFDTEEKLMGVCLGSHDGSRNTLRMIYVDEAHEGKGVGRALVERIGQNVFEEGLETDVWLATYNHEAAGFYERLGFVLTDERASDVRHKMPISGVVIPEMKMTRPKGRW